MVFKHLKRPCICASAFFLTVSFPLGALAESGKTNPTEPVTTSSIVRQPEGYSSDGLQAVFNSKPTDPVTVTSAIPEPSQPATDPVTTKSRIPACAGNTTISIVRQPEGYSSDGLQAVFNSKPTDSVTVSFAIPEPGRAATDPVTTASRIR
jgi:hypothetical protein